MASIGTVSGLGCMVGPVIGGVLHDAIPNSPAWAFRLPFLVCAAAPLLLLPPISRAVPQSYIKEEGLASQDELAAPSARPMTSRRGLLSLSFVLGLASVALSGTVVATLDPTLIYRLEAQPFTFSDAWVSYMFMFSSVVYVAVSIPIGKLVDTAASSPRALKATTALGFVVLALTFGLLAPAGPAAWGLRPSDAMQPGLNNVYVVVAAMLLKGVGSALSNNAVYPDLVLGHDPEDKMLQASCARAPSPPPLRYAGCDCGETLPTQAPCLCHPPRPPLEPPWPCCQATISGLWNAAYAVGWAAGPFLGGVLYDAFRVHTLCVGEKQLAACELGNATCSCVWLPDNGFDGFATTTALLCLLFALALFAAAAANVRNRPTHIDLASIAAPALDPLVATLADWTAAAGGAAGGAAKPHACDH